MFPGAVPSGGSFAAPGSFGGTEYRGGLSEPGGSRVDGDGDADGEDAFDGPSISCSGPGLSTFCGLEAVCDGYAGGPRPGLAGPAGLD